jgi:hypothetical protein
MLDLLSAPIKKATLDMNPLINEDCSNYFDDEMDEKAFCAIINVEYVIPECLLYHQIILRKALCSKNCETKHGEVMLHYINGPDKISTVIVGLSSALNFCDWDKPMVFTRVSAYKEWIESFM